MLSNEMNTNPELSNRQELEMLRSFLLDIDCLDRLRPWQYGVNFFEISGMTKREVKHSKVLSWILDANENHGLSDKVIKRFLQRVIKDDRGGLKERSESKTKIITDIIDVALMNFSSFVVKTEYKNIDILLLSEKEKTAIIIENKVYAGERVGGEDGGQLKKYLSSVEHEFSDYKKMPIFLTRGGELPSDTGNWYIADYKMLVDIIEQVIGNSTEPSAVSADAKAILEHYTKMIRRNLIMNEDLQRICKEIYYKHRGAIDLIIENRPNSISELSDFIDDCLKEIASKESIFIEDTNSTKKYIRFSTEYIREKLYQLPDVTFWFGHRLLYEFNCGESGIVFGAVAIPQDDTFKKLFMLGQQKCTEYGIKKTGKMPEKCATVVWRHLILSKDEVMTFDDETAKRDLKNKIKKEISELFSKIKKFEKDVDDYLRTNFGV